MISVVPWLLPVTTPEALTEAIAPSSEDHEPPAVAFVSGVRRSLQTLEAPDMSAGKAFTVTVFVAVHPSGKVNITVAFPFAIPISVPAALILATAAGVTLHVPPGVGSLVVIADPWHTPAGPSTGNGAGLMIISFVRTHPVVIMV